jgi:N-alpha-acetyltransferase 40
VITIIMATERELAGIQHKAIEKVNQTKNPFASIAEDFGTYERDELKLAIKFFSSKEMTKELQKFCFKLAERNVGNYYKSCALGWQPKKKQTDMAKSWAKFLIAYDDKKPVGYTMLRFDMDYGRSCVYW